MKNTHLPYEGLPAFNDQGIVVFYEPSYSVGRLDWFNIARCARERMSAKAGYTERWQGERRTFYSALLMMQVDDVALRD